MNSSISATYVILLVFLLRELFKNISPQLMRLLWVFVFIKLMLPANLFTAIRTIFWIRQVRLFPAELISNTGGLISSLANNIGLGQYVPTQSDVASTLPTLLESRFPFYLPVLAFLWIGLVIIRTVQVFVKVVAMKRKLGTAVHLRDNVYLLEGIHSPFVFGFFKPRIYMPDGLETDAFELMLAHETAHISQQDHILKPIAFAITSIHWFNPVVWITFRLLAKDMETACDEAVLLQQGLSVKKRYCQILLSLNTAMSNTCSGLLLSGNCRIKDRVKNILGYSKRKQLPQFFSMLIFVLLFAAIFNSYFMNINVFTKNYRSSIYTPQDIQTAIDTAKGYVENEMPSMRILNIWFDENQCSTDRSNYYKYSTVQIANLEPDDIIYIYSDLELMDAGSLSGIYGSWSFELIRDKNDGPWRITNQGH